MATKKKAATKTAAPAAPAAAPDAPATDPVVQDDEAPKPAAKSKDDANLVRVRKGHETLAVHPTCVAAHRAAGWFED